MKVSVKEGTRVQFRQVEPGEPFHFHGDAQGAVWVKLQGPRDETDLRAHLETGTVLATNPNAEVVRLDIEVIVNGPKAG